MRNAILLGTRLVLGGYLAVHGAQKLFGTFNGPGLDQTANGFENLGLTPARPMAILAGVTEVGGGVLTAGGIADPLGPLALMGAMTVATAVHREQGPLAANGGYELPLTNLATAAVLAAVGPGRFRLGPGLPKVLACAAAGGGAFLAAASVAQLVCAQPVASSAMQSTDAADELEQGAVFADIGASDE